MSVIALCALFLGTAAAILVAHPEYEDGLVGRAALGGVIVAGVLVVGSEFQGSEYSAPGEILLLILSITVFVARHLFRFLRWRRTGAYSWRPANK